MGSILRFFSITLALATHAAADDPFFMGLGDLPGGIFQSGANGISADASVVVGGGVSDGPDGGKSEAFRWTAAEGMVGLGDLDGGVFSSGASAVSANGQVVVGHGADAGFGSLKAFRWTQATGMVNIDDHGPDGSESHAGGVSADGSVVVGRSYLSAFRWTEATGMKALPGGDAFARGVSADGSVTVGADAGGKQACRWEGQNQFLMGWLPNDAFNAHSGAIGVSADGTVIVGSSVSFESGENQQAFLWTDPTGMVPLGDLPGELFISEARGVSADGSVVVGRSWGTHPVVDFLAFIWDADNGMRAMQDVLEDDHGMDLTGWILLEANAVSGDGLTIVGRGISPEGNYEAWIAHLGSACPADCDGSGDLSLFDFLCFVNLFNNDDPGADCDESGGLDLFDFLCFTNQFNAGC